MPRRKVPVYVRDDKASLTPGSLWWAYLRVSPGEKQRVASQQPEIQRFADRHGVLIVRWFVKGIVWAIVRASVGQVEVGDEGILVFGRFPRHLSRRKAADL